MRRSITIVLLAFCLLPVDAQENVERGTVVLDEVTVTAKRLLAEIGVQQTVLDSLSLRQSITQSLGDVLSQNSTLFIKSYGRATLSTASFRGSAPSHTQVTWNDIKLNSPMLGQVDFSMIPSFFIDKANLYHGASSTGVTGGGLGGAVTLATGASGNRGVGLRYVQGISSFSTFDEFLHLTYGTRRWELSTRILYSSSVNDFKYTNYRKKSYLTDDQGEIIGEERPIERNKNGGFNDLHLMQELYYDSKKGTRLGMYAWYIDSRRGIPMLGNNYNTEKESENKQNEQTVRAGANWENRKNERKVTANLGYTYTDLNYIYSADPGDGILAEMISSLSRVHTAFGKAGIEYYPNHKWLFISNVSVYQHYVKSEDRATGAGYRKARPELSMFASLRYSPFGRWGVALNVREEFYGDTFTPFIPGFFTDLLLSAKGSVKIKASVARNFRYPTLNDLYFVPGGNDSLRTEKGYTYDGGVEFTLKNKRLSFNGEVTGFNSYIKDWILWLPTVKGFWSPVNVKKVHSYGIELKGKFSADLPREWNLALDGNFAVTHSINQGESRGWADNSIGKQLVYIPRYSSALVGVLTWKSWMFTYKWNYYSKRFTTSSNEKESRRDMIGAYIMNDISLGKEWNLNTTGLNVKLTVNNLFNEAYESVLSRPMAGRNYGLFIGVVPGFRRK